MKLDLEYQKYFCDLKYLYEAYCKSHRGKAEDKTVIEFDKDILGNLYHIKKLLEQKKWSELFIYYYFVLFDPKQRDVYAMIFIGRIVQHVLCDHILRPWFEARVIYRNCACRLNKGTDFAIKYIKDQLNLILLNDDFNDWFVLKMDIHHYFQNIDRQIIKDILKDFPDGNIKDMLFFIIDAAPTGPLGIPIGNQTSQWFGLFYLDKFDRIIKEKYGIKIYVRYMDDAIILCKDKDLLIKIFADLNEFLKKERHLEFNPKSQIFPLRKGFSFLGWRFYFKYNKVLMRVDKNKLKLRKQKLRDLTFEFANGELSEKEYKQRIHSLDKFMQKGNTRKLWKNYFERKSRIL